MGYQERVEIVEPILKSAYSITVFGNQKDADSFGSRPPGCNLSIWIGGANISISMRPEDARNLASHLALAAIAAERGDAEIIDFRLAEERN
jgi:hypothetical protein